jgi:putative addiction module killer protein
MFEIIKSTTFEHWLLGLKDRMARARIQARIDRLIDGNPGDVKTLREGISEMRIDHGPGYRVYFIKRGPLVIVLLAGGDKRTQVADIDRPIAIAKDWRD